MASFKNKPDKIKYLSNISTLDEIHKKKVSDFNLFKSQGPSKKNQLEEYQKESDKLNMRNKNTFSIDDVKKRAFLKEQIEKLRNDISELDGGVTELDYYSRAGDILVEYYNILDDKYGDDNINSLSSDTLTDNCSEINIISKNDSDIKESKNDQSSDKLKELNILGQQKRKIKKPTKKRAKNIDTTQRQNILSFFTGIQISDTVSINEKKNNTDEQTDTSVTDTESSKLCSDISTPYNDIEKIVSNRATLFEEYMTLIDRSYVGNKLKSSPIRLCPECGIEKTLMQSEGRYSCEQCGITEYINIESEIPNHKEATSEKPRYPYKRLNHLIEWLNQFQAKESTEIPEDVYNNILLEIKKQRIENKIKNMKYVKLRSTIRAILRKLLYSQYYEHVPFIISKITHKPPPILSRDIEDKIKLMFKQIQEPFNKYCPPDRINFLNYSYILNKIFNMIHMEAYAKCFPLLKSREKLKLQDNIWKYICKDLEWDFQASI